MPKEGLIKDYYELIFREIQGVLSACYVLMVGLGMLFNYFRFSHWEINIFEYAGILDFLIAPFEDIRIMITAVVAVLLPYCFYRLDRWWSHRFPRSYHILSMGLSKKSWYDRSRTIAFSGLIIYFIFLSALLYGRRTKNETQRLNFSTFYYSDGEVENVRIIGKTLEVYFALDRDNLVQVIPITATLKKVEL